MTKAEMVKNIARQTGIEQTSISVVLEGFMEQVQQALVDGESVYLRGFGTFQRKHRAEKVARNISRNTTIRVPAHDIPSFKPSREFLDKIR